MTSHYYLYQAVNIFSGQIIILLEPMTGLKLNFDWVLIDPVSTVLELPSGFPSLSEQSQSFHKGQLSPAGPVPLCASLTYHLLFNVLTGFRQSELLTVLPLSRACRCIFLFAIPLLGMPFPGVCMAHSHIFNQMSPSQ